MTIGLRELGEPGSGRRAAQHDGSRSGSVTQVFSPLDPNIRALHDGKDVSCGEQHSRTSGPLSLPDGESGVVL